MRISIELPNWKRGVVELEDPAFDVSAVAEELAVTSERVAADRGRRAEQQRSGASERGAALSKVTAEIREVAHEFLAGRPGLEEALRALREAGASVEAAHADPRFSTGRGERNWRLTPSTSTTGRRARSRISAFRPTTTNT
jgi:hypothetical protein